MREYEVRVSPSAMNQMSEAVRYVHDELFMPQAAFDLLGDLESAIMGLSVFCNFDFWVFTTYYFRVSRFPARAHGQFP